MRKHFFGALGLMLMPLGAPVVAQTEQVPGLPTATAPKMVVMPYVQPGAGPVIGGLDAKRYLLDLEAAG